MTRPQETFTDMLARLFPMPGIQLGINSPHSKCITFQVTEDCNLRCSYCYQGCKTHRKMSLETAKAAVDMLLAADERTNQYITSTEVAGVVLDFIGGEPLLEVELIDQILDYFVAQTFRLHHPWATRWKASMSTNGTLYFRPEVQRFLDKWAKHLSLSISIDGDKQLHDSCRVFPDGSGSYDLAIAAAKDYMTKGNALGSKMTIAPGNVDYLYHAVIGLLDAGYRAINLNCVYEKGWTLDHAATLYTQLKRLADFVLLSDEQPYLSSAKASAIRFRRTIIRTGAAVRGLCWRLTAMACSSRACATWEPPSAMSNGPIPSAIWNTASTFFRNIGRGWQKWPQSRGAASPPTNALRARSRPAALGAARTTTNAQGLRISA